MWTHKNNLKREHSHERNSSYIYPPAPYSDKLTGETMAVLVRVSTSKQDFQSQIDAGVKDSTELGMSYEVYKDKVSGKYGKGLDFNRLIADIEEGKKKYVWVDTICRLSRDDLIGLKFLITLWCDYGGRLFVRNPKLDSAIPSDRRRIIDLLEAEVEHEKYRSEKQKEKLALIKSKNEGKLPWVEKRWKGARVFTVKKLRAIELLIAEGWSVRDACLEAGVSRAGYYQHRKKPITTGSSMVTAAVTLK